MRNFKMNFILTIEDNTTEDEIESFEDGLIELCENHNFMLGGHMIELDKEGNIIDEKQEN